MEKWVRILQKIAITDYVKVKHGGLRKSEIYDINALSEALRTAISKVESVESPITRLSLALGGPGVGSNNSKCQDFISWKRNWRIWYG